MVTVYQDMFHGDLTSEISLRKSQWRGLRARPVLAQLLDIDGGRVRVPRDGPPCTIYCILAKKALKSMNSQTNSREQ